MPRLQHNDSGPLVLNEAVLSQTPHCSAPDFAWPPQDDTHTSTTHDLYILSDPDDEAEFLPERVVVVGVLDTDISERRVLRFEV